MRFVVTIFLCLGNLFVILEASQAQQNIIDLSSRAGKETWLTSTLSYIRRAAVFKGKWPLATVSSKSGIGALHPEVWPELEVADEKTKLPEPLSSAFKTVLSRKSEQYHNPTSYATGKQVTVRNSLEKFAGMFLAGPVPKHSPPNAPEIEINSTAESELVRQTAGGSASASSIPSVLFEDVVICKARNPVWNVGIRTKLGGILVVAYPGSLAKAETFARCIRDDVISMKREEYLKFAAYNCVGTDKCPINSATGVCSCALEAPERCINVDYTRALIECKYGPGV